MSWFRQYLPILAALMCLVFMAGATGCKTMEKHRRDLDTSDDEEPVPGPNDGPDPRPPPT